MQSLGIIPARGGSKGIPRKNIRPLGGKPLIAYTIAAAQASGLTRCVVSTDDDEIASVARDYGAEVLKRPPHLAQDATPTLPVLQDVVAQLGDAYDVVATLQPTSPFRTAKHIDDCLALMERHPEADSLVSVVKVPHSMTPESIMIKDGVMVRPFQPQSQGVLRRQDKGSYYARNGAAVYLTRGPLLARAILGDHILAYEMGKIESLDLDDLEDWAVAEALAAVRFGQ